MSEKNSRPTALVTGATGFIGSHVAAAATAAGFDVVALVRGATDRAGRVAFPGEVRRGDLADEASLDAAVAGVDTVFHLAGLTRARDEAAFMDANAEGVARLVRACRRSAPGLRRFVYVSSLAAGGPSAAGRPVVESDPPAPVSAYGRSKLAGEVRLREEAGALPWTVVRPPIVYGPEERDVLELFRAARRGFVPCVGTGEERYSVVYGPDLAQGIVAAALAPAAAGRTYYVAERADYSQHELAAHFGAAVGRSARVLALPRWLGRLAAAGGSALKPFLRRPPLLTLDKLPEVLAPGWSCSPAAAERDFGFVARTPLAEGARATAAWYRERGWLPA